MHLEFSNRNDQPMGCLRKWKSSLKEDIAEILKKYHKLVRTHECTLTLTYRHLMYYK